MQFHVRLPDSATILVVFAPTRAMNSGQASSTPLIPFIPGLVKLRHLWLLTNFTTPYRPGLVSPMKVSCGLVTEHTFAKQTLRP